MPGESKSGHPRYGGDSIYWMAMRRNRSRTHLARRPSRIEASRRQVMADWYGPERAAGEIRARDVPARSVGEVIPELFRELRKHEDLTVASLQNAWPRICGGELARQTWPVALRNHCLVIEVRDPGWMYSLANFQKQDILGAVQSCAGDRVRDVSFIPAGRRSPGVH